MNESASEIKIIGKVIAERRLTAVLPDGERRDIWAKVAVIESTEQNKWQFAYRVYWKRLQRSVGGSFIDEYGEDEAGGGDAFMSLLSAMKLGRIALDVISETVKVFWLPNPVTGHVEEFDGEFDDEFFGETHSPRMPF